MLAFMRHGETDWNRAQRLQGGSDIPLNRTGRAQAVEAAERMRGMDPGWDLVVTSPLVRARETGQIVARELGVELGGTYPGLVERSFGPSEGLSIEGITPTEYDRLLEGAELEHLVVDRALAVLHQVKREFPQRNVLLVAHGALIRFTVAHLQDTEPVRVKNAEVVPVDEGLLSVPTA
ncbi:histidine phosphatase family protein [Kocuria sp. JC486]|uniref:Histidine phosphatase family protein n=1 Tax=Kocuria soli TaxID=2485125 RepID=A0A3N4AAX8_9MICC|nr:MULTISPECIES: histidine phosphatase family protein [Kocuria]NHU85830.1 histidine phosphatase family protein [Kocuria sp. JC486]ROZ62875.1 histidine phosphatase family protein [Kocuria soli]